MNALTTPVLVALAAAAPPEAAQGRPGLTATFIGNMAVHISDGSTSLVTDFPYESGRLGYMSWTPALVPAGPMPLCLITHSHRDHFAPEAAAEHCASLLGPADATAGFEAEVVAMSETVSRRGLTIHAIRTPHAGLEHYSYRVSWQDVELYFTGDTDDPTALLQQRDLDAAFVNSWLLEAVESHGGRVDARQVILYHHYPGTTQAPYDGVRIPVQGERLSLGGVTR